MFKRKVEIIEKPIVTVGSAIVAYNNIKLTQKLTQEQRDEINNYDMNTSADVEDLRSKVVKTEVRRMD